MTNATRFPIDLEDLAKGDVFNANEICRIYNVQVDSREFSLAALRLKVIIEKHFEMLGETLTVIIQKNAVRILTDEQAYAYNNRLFRQLNRRMFVTHDKNQAVDITKLSAKQRVHHLRVLQRQAMVLRSQKQAWQAPLLPSKRQKPGLLP